MLDSAELDLAVARGAAYYGMVRRGKGIRIRGGVPRSYYVGIETSARPCPGVPAPIKALCVVPMGMEEGTEADVPGSQLGLVVGEAAEFRFLASTVRRDDADRHRAGPLVARRVAGVVAAGHRRSATRRARKGDVVPVTLHSVVTEVGTLELWCEGTREPGPLEAGIQRPGTGRGLIGRDARIGS